jgi:hypothetical protein
VEGAKVRQTLGQGQQASILYIITVFHRQRLNSWAPPHKVFKLVMSHTEITDQLEGTDGGKDLDKFRHKDLVSNTHIQVLQIFQAKQRFEQKPITNDTPRHVQADKLKEFRSKLNDIFRFMLRGSILTFDGESPQLFGKLVKITQGRV